jgi:hypothetical protein
MPTAGLDGSSMQGARSDFRTLAVVLACVLMGAASNAPAAGVYNSTGLPVYPNLMRARMDDVARTDALGHWCIRFAADTFDRLDLVEAWYRKALVGASETDLNHDERYRSYAGLSGIKLARGIDSVAVFRTANQSTTSIELFRCSVSR